MSFDAYKILEDIIEILIISIFVHENHHFYYKKYKFQEYADLKNKDMKKQFRKDKQLEILADNFMLEFMQTRGTLDYEIARLVEKLSQKKNDGYTADNIMNNIVEEVKKLYEI